MNKEEYDGLITRANNYLNQNYPVKEYSEAEGKNNTVMYQFVGIKHPVAMAVKDKNGNTETMKYQMPSAILMKTPKGPTETLSLDKVVEHFESKEQ